MAAAAAARQQGQTAEELHASDYETYAYLQTAQDHAAERILRSLPEIAARLDAVGAEQWYDEQQQGLGARFSAELDDAIAKVTERPTSFPIAHNKMRRASLDHFPYGIFFVIEPERIVVLGVIDLRREPRTWQRLRHP